MANLLENVQKLMQKLDKNYRFLSEVNESNQTNDVEFVLDQMSQLTLQIDGDGVNESDDASAAKAYVRHKKNWEVNNYQRFLEIVNKTPRQYKGYLTQHPMDEITQQGWLTYTLKGHDVAFALHMIEP